MVQRKSGDTDRHDTDDFILAVELLANSTATHDELKSLVWDNRGTRSLANHAYAGVVGILAVTRTVMDILPPSQPIAAHHVGIVQGFVRGNASGETWPFLAALFGWHVLLQKYDRRTGLIRECLGMHESEFWLKRYCPNDTLRRLLRALEPLCRGPEEELDCTLSLITNRLRSLEPIVIEEGQTYGRKEFAGPALLIVNDSHAVREQLEQDWRKKSGLSTELPRHTVRDDHGDKFGFYRTGLWT